jgi:hypothetical protein
VPKSVGPTLAYEWANYRFSQARINSNKGNSTDVLDPFHVTAGSFVLDIATFFVKPGTELDANAAVEVDRTIRILQLNSTALVKLRYTVLKEYSDGHRDFSFLQRRYPFIAAELRRQDLVVAVIGTVT